MSSRNSMSRIAAAALLCAGTAAASFLAAPPAHAEKTAAQVKCEEDGGTWVDKGNGNTFCFKKLPPMEKASGPGGGVTHGGSDCDDADAVAREIKTSASQNGQVLRTAAPAAKACAGRDPDTGCGDAVAPAAKPDGKGRPACPAPKAQ